MNLQDFKEKYTEVIIAGKDDALLQWIKTMRVPYITINSSELDDGQRNRTTNREETSRDEV